MLLACFASQGFFCSEKHELPSLPTPLLTDIRLKISDPSVGTAGVFITWTYSDPKRVSYFELYETMDLNDLKNSVRSQPATDSPTAILPLPDSSRPITVYFAVRAVWVEPTGQKLVSDTLKPDSITITPSLSINKPASGSFIGGRVLNMEVQTSSDPGVMLRMAYYEKDGAKWMAKQDTCLPLDRCGQPIFGPSLQRDSLILEQHGATDTIPALFCVEGTESFQEQRTGLAQSISCSRFFRVNP